MVRKQLEKLFGKNKGEIINIDIDMIDRNPYQPRKEFNEDEIVELAQSIKSYGLIQPIVVRKVGERFQLIAGERRLRAHNYLELKKIPALVQDMDDENTAVVSLVENLQRRELNYFEEANAYSILIDVFGMTQEDLAKKIGKSQSAIANKLRLLRLPEQVRNMLSPGVVSERHARALLKLNTVENQLEVIRQIYKKDLTVKETEDLVEQISHNNIPQNNDKKDNKQQISLIIRDARIFINTIRETVKRAKQTGVSIVCIENDDDEEYEIVIRIGKKKKLYSKIQRGR